MRDSHTLTRFHGINTIDSPANVKPQYALAARNVIGTPSGDLWQARSCVTRYDLGAAAAGPITSLGVFDSHASTATPARLVIQQGRVMGWVDAPALDTYTQYGGPDLPANPGRFDYAEINSILYFSGFGYAGKIMPGETVTRPSGIPQSAIPSTIPASTTMLGVTSIQRAGGVVTLTFAAAHASLPGQPVYVDAGGIGAWDASFSGAYTITTTPAPNTVTYVQPGLLDSGPYSRGVYPEGITAATGYQYRGSWGDGTGGWGTASATTTVVGPLAQQSPVVISPYPPDPSYVSYALWRNLDNGGDWYLVDTYSVQADGPFTGRAIAVDTTTDSVLQSSGQTPPYDNGVAFPAKYLCPHLDRILATGIPGDEKAVRYSGYDSIPFGRPSDTWPQFNRITVGEGSVTPIAIGTTRYGPVIFGDNKSMYIVRGALQDITTSAVTSLSFRVDELPFQTGCYSHFTVQSTPLGIVFLDDSLNISVFDGYNPPQVAAPVIQGIMALMTPGSADRLTSAYINWLDRQWYVLSIPVSGMVTNTLTVILDLTSDDVRSSGCWVTDHSLDFVVSILNPDKTKVLACAQSQPTPASANPASVGVISTLPFMFDPTDTNLMPNAYWRGGYMGISDADGVDEWAYYKLWRFVRLQGDAIVTMTAYLVDGNDYTYTDPLVVDFKELDSVFSVNTKCRALSPLIKFPDGGPGAPVSGATVNWNFAGKR